MSCICQHIFWLFTCLVGCSEMSWLCVRWNSFLLLNFYSFRIILTIGTSLSCNSSTFGIVFYYSMFTLFAYFFYIYMFVRCSEMSCWSVGCSEMSCWSIRCSEMSCWSVRCSEMSCLSIRCSEMSCWCVRCSEIILYSQSGLHWLVTVRHLE
jgi:hypothetical protein